MWLRPGWRYRELGLWWRRFGRNRFVESGLELSWEQRRVRQWGLTEGLWRPRSDARPRNLRQSMVVGFVAQWVSSKNERGVSWSVQNHPALYLLTDGQSGGVRVWREPVLFFSPIRLSGWRPSAQRSPFWVGRRRRRRFKRWDFVQMRGEVYGRRWTFVGILRYWWRWKWRQRLFGNVKGRRPVVGGDRRRWTFEENWTGIASKCFWYGWRRVGGRMSWSTWR